MSTPYLGIGPANYAGQAHEWARAVRTHLPARAESFNRGPIRRGEFRFATDREIPGPLFFSPHLRHLRMNRFLSRYSHVAIDGFTTFFQLPQWRDVAADVPWLASRGFHMGLIGHGGEVRSPAAHMERNKWSYFHEGDQAYRDRLTATTEKTFAMLRSFEAPVFVSTPDLLHDLPTATWLPLVVDVDGFATTEPVMERPRPRVLHMPSRTNPPIKGTQYIEPVLRRLEAEGLVEYVRPERMRHDQVPAMMAGADIVIDQILTGSYGVTAIEAMAAGRLTIAGVGEATRALMPEDPPIVDADPDTLEEVLRGLLADREGSRATAEAGLRFVQRWHDGRRSASRMAGYLGVAEPRLDD